MTGRRRWLALGLLVIVSSAGCFRADLHPVIHRPAVDGGATDAGIGLAIYVAPDGDDGNPGTPALPLRTLVRARDLVRTLNGAMTGDITVYLRGGTYPQTSTLTFGNADSGTGGFYVRYMAFPGERPLVTGGRPIKGWSRADAGSDLYSASAGPTPFRQLYVGGSKATRARSPNLGSDGSPNFYRLSGYDTAAHNVQLASAYVADWRNLGKVEMHLFTAWADNTLRIASVSTVGNTAYVKLQSAEDAILFVRPNPKLDQMGTGPGRAFFFENALEMLDQPGEWYLDETTSTVYYKPRPGEDMATAMVIAPALETIMSVQGNGPSDGASYLWFAGLTFAHSTYLRPSQSGFLDAQAGQYNLTAQANNHQTVGHPPAGVSVTNAHHIRFERNLFAQMGATGLDLVSGTHDDLIIGNVFTDIGGNGISIGKFTADETTEFHVPYNPADKTEICTRDTISNNYVDHVTTEFQGGSGIAAGYPAYLTVEHNEVTRTASDGISVGYGWTTAPNAMTNNKINYNHVHHVALLLAGAAGISTLSNQGPSSEIQFNYLHDFGQSRWADYPAVGMYLNEGSAGFTVAHNVMQNTPGLSVSPNTGSNLLTDNSSHPAAAEDIIASAGIEPAYVDIKTLSLPTATF